MKQIIFWIIIVSLIIFRYFSTRSIYHNGDTVRVTSVVYSDPIKYPKAQYIKAGGLKFYLPVFPEISYGDLIIVEGIVNNGKLDNPKLIGVTESRGVVANFRNKIIGFYQSSLPEPYAGLISGTILGSKGAISEDFWEKVKYTGVAHVVVASGTNVTFVVSFLMGVLTLFLSRRKAIWLALLGILLYLFISGFDAPLVRAAIMSVVAFMAQETGRLSKTTRNLFLAAGVMLIIKPDWVTDIGFMLSFVSTASIMLFEKKIRDYLEKLPEVFKEGLSTSLAAQIGVAPILFVTFGQFNIWSPVVNALVLWTIAPIMLLGAVGGVVGLIIPFMGKAILYLVYPLTWWFIQVVNIFSF